MSEHNDLSSLGMLDLIVISTDLDGQVTIFNKVAEETLGYSSGDIVGEEIPLHDFNLYKASILQQTNSASLANFNHRNGSKVNLELNTASIKDKTGEVTGLLFTATKPLRLPITSKAQDLPNMQVLEIVLEREIKRLARSNHDMSLLKCDVDFFKRYLAKYGETMAKACLNNIAWCLQERIKRAGDLLVYTGNDEFLVLLPNTDQSGAVTVAEHLRLIVAGLEIENAASKIGTTLTISVGIYHCYPNVKTSKHTILAGAEEALKKAKADGRNCSRFISTGSKE